jgi:hypothetical protein
MPYQIDRFDGTTLVTLADGVVDISTDLQLVGRNVAGFGEIQNENFVHLLENFARADTPPSKALVGQLWFDKNANKLRPSVFDGVQWRQLSLLESTTTEPQNRKEGDMWWDSTNNQLYVWTADGNQHVLVGPESIRPFATTRWVTTKLTDTSAVDHPVTIGYINGVAYAVIADTQFTIDQNVTPLVGFTDVYRGITLDGTSATGQTATTRFFGTAKNADRLGDRPADEYAHRFDNETITGYYHFANDAGITVGDSQELHLKIYNTDQPALVNETGTNLSLGVNYVGSSTDKRVLILNNKEFIPYQDNEVNLGSPTLKYRNVYADAIYANIIGDIVGSHVGVSTGDTFGNHVGNSAGAHTGILKASGGATIVDNDAVTAAPKIPASAGTVEGRFEGTARFVDYGAYYNADNTFTGNNLFSGTNEFDGTSKFDGTVLTNGTLQSAGNTLIKEGVIGDGAIGAIQLGDLVIGKPRINDAEINTTLFKGGELREGTAINGAKVGDSIPVQWVKSQIYYDTQGHSFTKISSDVAFTNADNTTVMTAFAIKEYVDAKIDDVATDIQFYIDNKDMSVDDVKTQLTRIAPPLDYPEGTKARILGAHYFNNIGTDYNGNKRYVVFYGQGQVLRGIGYIGGRATSSNVTSTDVLTAKSGFTGYLFQREAGGTPVQATDQKNNSSDAGNIVTQINSRTFTGWIEFDNPIPQAVANAFGDPAIVNARVIAVDNGVVRDYSSTQNTAILYDNVTTYTRANVEDYETTATIGGVSVHFEVYDYNAITYNVIANWVFKNYI